MQRSLPRGASSPTQHYPERLAPAPGPPRPPISNCDHGGVAGTRWTVFEHKGPTDDLEPGDALTLLGYAAQYMRLVKVSDPAELCLMVVADRIPPGFFEQLKRLRGSLMPMGRGLWRGELAGMMLHGVETREACRGGATERLLYAFSRAYLNAPEGILPLDEEEQRVYTALYQQVERFRKKRGSMAMRDLEAAQKSYEEVYAEIIDRIPLKIRVRGLTPEQRLEGLTPKQRVQLAKLLTAEQLLEGLTPEQRVQLAKLLTSDPTPSASPPARRDQVKKKRKH